MCTNFGRERHENAFSQVVSFVGGSLPKFVHAQKQKACWSVKVTGQQAEEGAQATYREDATGPGFYLWRSMASARIFSASALSPQPEPVTSLLGSRSL